MLTNRSCKLELAIKVAIIAQLRKDKAITLSTSRICEIFRLCRGTYYSYLKPSSKVRVKSNLDKEKRIIKAFELNIGTPFRDRVYGVEKLKQELDKNVKKSRISRQKIRKVMRDHGLYPVYMMKYKQKYWRKDLETRINIINGNFDVSTPNTIWSADITYIWIEKMGWCYLSSIIDLCTRKVISWSFDTSAHAINTIRVLEKAIRNEKPPSGLILHTDQGVQYTSFEFERLCLDHEIIHSYSAKGTPLDNAPIESFHAILKKEEVYAKIYSGFEQARMSLFRYIEGFYNRQRLHSKLGYLSPCDFEKQYYKQIS